MRIIVAITGATGAPFGVRILELLRDAGVEIHLVMSTWGRRTVEHETGRAGREVERLADVTHSVGDLAAVISSGSFRTDGMIIAPCSVRTLAAIANGLADNLVTRAADVVLKERRRLVLLVRETPFSEIHLENMVRLARMGAVILPPTPAFYNHPESIDDILDHLGMRALDQFGLDIETVRTRRWDGRLRRGETDRPLRDETLRDGSRGSAAARPGPRPPR